jgi:hypothetical protein
MKKVDWNLETVSEESKSRADSNSQMLVFLDEVSDQLGLPTPSDSSHYDSLRSGFDPPVFTKQGLFNKFHRNLSLHIV